MPFLGKFPTQIVDPEVDIDGGAIDGVTIGATTASAATVTTLTSGNITTTGYIAGPSTFTIDPAAVGDNTGTLVVAGNLQVDGTTTTINSTTMTVDDLNITLASGAANAAAADGAGITVDGASATLTYNSTPDAWSFNKNVGIGTTSPISNLEVVGGSSSNVTIRGTSGGGADTDAILDLTARGSGNQFRNTEIRSVGANAAGGVLIFSTDNTSAALTERMRIDSSGNVDISSGDLHISTLNAKLTLGPTLNNASGDFGIRSSTPQITLEPTADAQSSRIQFANTSGTIWGSIFGFNDTERMQFTADTFNFNNGKVGIGTDSPAGPLHIQSATNRTLILDATVPTGSFTWQSVRRSGVEKFRWFINNNDSMSLYSDAGTTYVQTWLTDGKVGIGTASPETKLHITSATKDITVLKLENYLSTTNGSSYDNYQELKFVAASADQNAAGIRHHANVWSTGHSALSFWTSEHGGSYAERMRIDGPGNLLVGSTTLDQANNSNTANCGVNLFADGVLSASRNGNIVAYFNRLSSDGPIMEFRKGGTPMGDIASYSSAVLGINLRVTTNKSGLRGAASSVIPWYDNADRDNELDLGRSSTRWKDIYLSGGAYLGGTAAANHLDDYEEGTWTPALKGTSGGTVSISGTYTKIGRCVTVRMGYWSAIAANTLTGNLYVSGLPFTGAGNPYGNGAGTTSTGLLHIRGTSSIGSSHAPFAVVEASIIKLHDSSNLGSTGVYSGQTSTYAASKLTQNGSTSIIIDWQFSYMTT